MTKDTLKQNLVFNYSSVSLTDDMTKLLNRGLNFAILPLKLDKSLLILKDLRDLQSGKNFGLEKKQKNINLHFSKKKTQPSKELHNSFRTKNIPGCCEV